MSKGSINYRRHRMRIPKAQPMSESQPSKVFTFDDTDPEMQAAYEKARATFRYFWREVAWEQRRIVPGLDLAAVKAPFSDSEKGDRTKRSSRRPANEFDAMAADHRK
jgi:hypothetical protein